MTIYRKRRSGTEIDYLIFNFLSYKIFITRSVLFSKCPRIVIWKIKDGDVVKSYQYSL